MSSMPEKMDLSDKEDNLGSFITQGTRQNMAQGQKKSIPKNFKQSGEGKKKVLQNLKSKVAKKRASGSMAQDNGHGEEGDPASLSKPDSAGKKAKAKKEDIPTNPAHFSNGDRLIIRMKEAGHTWIDINVVYAEQTGRSVGPSTLRNRYLKLKEVVAEWKHGDIERMIVAHERIVKEKNESVAAFITKAENQLWEKTAQAMVELGADVYPAGVIEKAWLREKKGGFPHRATIDAVISGSLNDEQAMTSNRIDGNVGNGSFDDNVGNGSFDGSMMDGNVQNSHHNMEVSTTGGGTMYGNFQNGYHAGHPSMGGGAMDANLWNRYYAVDPSMGVGAMNDNFPNSHHVGNPIMGGGMMNGNFHNASFSGNPGTGRVAMDGDVHNDHYREFPVMGRVAMDVGLQTSYHADNNATDYREGTFAEDENSKKRDTI